MRAPAATLGVRVARAVVLAAAAAVALGLTRWLDVYDVVVELGIAAAATFAAASAGAVLLEHAPRRRHRARRAEHDTT